MRTPAETVKGPAKVKPKLAEIRLAGQRIAVKCSDTDPELVDEVVELVARLIQGAEVRGKFAAPHQIALLALLDLAEEYVKAKRRTSDYRDEMNQKASALVTAIEDLAK